MANTVIQLKYSQVNATPTSLNVAEPAYSYVSNTFFIGSPSGTGVIPIGGKFYLDQQQSIYDSVNAAFQQANTGATSTYAFNQANSAFFHANSAFSTANGAVAVNTTQNNSIAAAFYHANAAYGKANTADTNAGNAQTTADNAAAAASNAQSTADGAVAVNTTQNNSIAAAFAAANAATATNTTQNNSITFASDTANAAFANANSYITRNEAVNVTQNNRTDAAFTRANNSLSANNGGTVTGDVSITGNLYVTGNVVSISTTEIVANDSLIVLGLGNYTSDLVDIGFAGHYNDGTNAHSGIIRDSSNKEFYVFDGYTPEIGANNNINPNHASFNLSTLNANLKSQTVRIKNIDILPYANIIYDTANAAFAAANAATATDTTQNNSITAAFNHANAAFASANNIDGINATQNTNITSVTNTATSAFNHANAAFNTANTDVTNVSITAANYGTASAVASFRVEANGRITSANNTAIAISADAITSGTLPVGRGGTGATTFTTNGVLLGQGTSAFSTASSSTEGHVLTINASGVPTFTYLQGGTF